MQFKASPRLALAAAALMILSPAAIAQDEPEDGATQEASAEQEDEGGFPWGVLGILGLAGLLGAQRRERHIHIDARRNR